MGQNGHLSGKIAWITGAGSGIGEAAAHALAAEGAEVVLTGRTRDKLDAVAKVVASAGGTAQIQPADVSDAGQVDGVARFLRSHKNRCDILVNNAGLNVRERTWAELSASGAAQVVQGNLVSAFNCVIAALPLMRAQGGGLIIHTSSWAGRFVGGVSGAAYTAAKHGVVAMSTTINMEECANNIRSTVFCPGEVATPILDGRPNPPSADVRARMLQSADCGDLIRYIACLPPHVCMNEVVLSPTANRGYLAQRANRFS